MKEDDLYQKTRKNMVFSVYMHRRYKHSIALLAKKPQKETTTKMPLPKKNTPRGDISGITKKMMFILENMVFLLKYHID